MTTSKDWLEVLESASGDVRRLSYADRFTTIPVNIRENVAEHSYWVAFYAVLIHRHIFPGESCAPLLGAISLYALVHDLPECITGDVVRTFKYSSEALKNAIDDAEDLMVEKLPGSVQELFPLWKTLAGDKVSYVKAVVKAADFLSLFQYLNRERLRGNEEILPFLERMRDDLHMMGKAVANSIDPDVAQFASLYTQMSVRIGTRSHYTT